MPACHIDHAGRRRLAFLDDPKLLKRRPTPTPLWTRQNRNLAHVCSFACKSISKLSQPRLPIGRRSSPEGYADPRGNVAPFLDISHKPPRLRGAEGTWPTIGLFRPVDSSVVEYSLPLTNRLGRRPTGAMGRCGHIWLCRRARAENFTKSVNPSTTRFPNLAESQAC